MDDANSIHPHGLIFSEFFSHGARIDGMEAAWIGISCTIPSHSIHSVFPSKCGIGVLESIIRIIDDATHKRILNVNLFIINNKMQPLNHH